MAQREEITAVLKQHPGLKRRFKSLCTALGLDMSTVIEQLIFTWVQEQEQKKVQEEQRKTIADLVRENFDQLVSSQVKSLEALINGSQPTESDLERLASLLGRNLRELREIAKRSSTTPMTTEPTPPNPPSLAQLIQVWDLKELAKVSRIKPARLKELANGDKPTEQELIFLGRHLRQPDGTLYQTEALMEVAERDFPQNNHQEEDKPITNGA